MIHALNRQGQKCVVGIVQWAPGTSVSEEIPDISRNYDIDYIHYKVWDEIFKLRLKDMVKVHPLWWHHMSTMASEIPGNFSIYSAIF